MSRVKELLLEMSVEEKVAQLSCVVPSMVLENGVVCEEKLSQVAPYGIGRMTQFPTAFLKGSQEIAQAYNAIQKYLIEKTRLSIPFIAQSETLVGLPSNQATIFPASVSVSSTWDEKYAEDIGRIISKEAKALGIRQALSPVSDVARDARWCRYEESYGEDVLLVSNFTAAKVKGLQGENYGDNVIATAKHFLGYAASDRALNAATVYLNERELIEVYGTPFAQAIKESALESVMVTYSEVDGLPMTVNKHYLQDVLKGRFGFSGSILCDGGSIGRVQILNGVGKNKEDVAARSLLAGIDADTPVTDYYKELVNIAKRDPLVLNRLDAAVSKILEQKEALGLFDNPYVDVDAASNICFYEKSNDIVQEIADKSITLLKNNGVLPLRKSTRKITVVGSFAKSIITLFPSYSFPAFAEMYINIVINEKVNMEGVSDVLRKTLDRENIKKVFSLDADGSATDNLNTFLRSAYNAKSVYDEIVREFCDSEITYIDSYDLDVIKSEWDKIIDSDVIIAVCGETSGFVSKVFASGESGDNSNIGMYEEQSQCLHKLKTAGSPIVMVLLNGRPLAIEQEDKLCAAIIEAWHPGQMGSTSIAKTLSGANNPSGKLPVTLPRAGDQCPIYYAHKGQGYRPIHFTLDQTDMIMKKDTAPLYHFGHGLSYTTFEYSTQVSDTTIQVGERFSVEVAVKNSGMYNGDEVVQIYTQLSNASVGRPVMELRGYKRINIDPGESKTVRFTFDTKQFAFLNEDGKFVVEPCKVRVFVGASSVDLKSDETINMVGETLKLADDERVFYCTVAVD